MIIGISGVARSGKDTLGAMLHNRSKYHKRSFAGNLKTAASEIFGFTEDQLHGDLKEILDPYWGFTPRWALQFLGTDLCRKQLDEDIWVRSTMRQMDENEPLSRPWVLTDVRFRNEAAAIHRRGGIVVRINRDGVGASNGIVEHASEDLSDVPYNFIVANNGTVSDLKPWMGAIELAVRDAYEAQVQAAAAFVEGGGDLLDYKIRVATNPHFIPFTTDYQLELADSRISLRHVRDTKFIERVESELDAMNVT